MAIYKNKASQKLAVYAYDSTDASAKTGDAANISAQISLDGGATAATDDTAPTELDATDAPGVYIFDMTQAETNADMVVLAAVSATSNILLESLLIYTQPELRDVNVTTTDATALDAVLKTSTFALAMADAIWDEILTGATHNIATSAGRRLRGIQEFQGYEGGSVWFDSVNGAAGTTDFENGTVENPCNSEADVTTLLASLGLTSVHVAPGSTYTLEAAYANKVFLGENWTLVLDGQSIIGMTFIGASVSGVAAGTGTTQQYKNCLMGATSHIKGTHFIECGLGGTQSVVEAGDFFFDRCHPAMAGTSSVTFDFGAARLASNLNVRHHSGGWTIENMGANAGTYNASFEGYGQIVWAASCSATSNASIRGMWKITDQASGAVTETHDDNSTTTALYAAGPPSNFATLVIDANGRVDVSLIEGNAAASLLVTAPWSQLLSTMIGGSTIGAALKTLQAEWDDGGRLDALIDAIKAVTDALPNAGALTDLAAIKLITDALPDAGALTDLAAIKAVTDLHPNSGAFSNLDATITSRVADASIALGVAGEVTVGTLTAGALASVWSTSLTEAYGTDGVVMTGAQLLYMLLAHMGEHAISGTTKTVKKLDGVSAAATFTLDNATTPTSITRAT